MPLSTEPCEKHELTNCSFCTGQDRRFTQTLEPLSTRDRIMQWAIERGALPRIPGGATIFSQFASTCAGCGRRWAKGEPIHHSKDHDGWIGVSCCV